MAHAEPTWAPSWPWQLTTNAALPMRFRPQIFWSSLRASRRLRKMPTRSSSVRPSTVWRSCKWRAERSSSCLSSTLAMACLLLATAIQSREVADLVDTCVVAVAGEHHGRLDGREAVLFGGVEDGERRVVDLPDVGVRPLTVVAGGRPFLGDVDDAARVDYEIRRVQ